MMDISREMSQIFNNTSPLNVDRSLKSKFAKQQASKRRKAGSPSNLYVRMAGQIKKKQDRINKIKEELATKD